MKEKVRITPPNYCDSMNYPPNHKTRHITPRTIDTEWITPPPRIIPKWFFSYVAYTCRWRGNSINKKIKENIGPTCHYLSSPSPFSLSGVCRRAVGGGSGAWTGGRHVGGDGRAQEWHGGRRAAPRRALEDAAYVVIVVPLSLSAQASGESALIPLVGFGD